MKFRSASFSGFQVGAMMGLGNTTNFSTGKTLSFALSYANGPFKAGATYANEHNRTPSIVTTGLTTFQGVAAANYSADKVENMGAGASYQFGKLLVHGLYTRVKLESAGHSDTYQSYDVGANYQFTPFNTVAGGALTGSGVGLNVRTQTIGITKAYTTRVGTGPFPSEIETSEPETAQRIRKVGAEFGATTGRPRRTGWLDLVALKYAVEVNGLTGIALMKPEQTARSCY